MPFSPSPAFALSLALLLLVLAPFATADGSFELPKALPSGRGQEHGLGIWRRFAAELPSAGNVTIRNGTFVLAAERTNRKDPLNGYRRYTGGWNISEQHYWASVGLTATPLFAIGTAWFVGFGLVLLVMCCCYCCCRWRNSSYSSIAYTLSLILLILFTIAAIIGCGVLYKGQGKFHSSTMETLDYVVGQANLTAENLSKFSSSLAAAKNVGVDKVFLPADVQSKIDTLQEKLNTSSYSLSTRTEENSKKIHVVLDSIRMDLIVIAAVMLFLAFLGFTFSVLGLRFLVGILVVIGWFLVAGTFILCGIFLLMHNVVGDTCVAMDEWVAHPQAHTALDDILPCVDVATANESMLRGREVTFQLVNVVNQVVVNISNRNFPPMLAPLYYNQSGPLVPALCNPYTLDMSNRTCAEGEVNFNNAHEVWKKYICKTAIVSGNEICTTVGRLSPNIYSQMIAATNVSQGLYFYGPFLTQLSDCTFVRETFTSLTNNNCPGLELHIKWIYIGLVMVSASIMLSVIFWVVYTRERRHRQMSKQFLTQSAEPHMALHGKPEA